MVITGVQQILPGSGFDQEGEDGVFLFDHIYFNLLNIEKYYLH